MKTLAPNTMIQNRYLVVHPIGKGGMGEVYLAVDQRLGSAVALKRTFFVDNEELGTAFEREARILARLRHPVLPKVIDHFVENGDQYLVMEHISGDDLAKRLETAKKPFPVTWVMFWADQLLDALSYLHSHEPPIVHRDIKPQNLKLTDDNHIVLLDFGLSKDFDTKSTGNPLNSASVAGYSPHFASMEQIRGAGTDGRSDIYSLSATLYQLMTNTVPVDALSRADAMLGGEPDPVRPLTEIASEISPAISAAVLKGLAVRQDERYANAAEMQKALRRAFNKGIAPAKSTEAPADAALETAPAASVGQTAELPTREKIPVAGSTMDATLQLGNAPAPTAPLKQSDVKTEVFSAADVTVPELTEPSEKAAAAGEKTEVLPVTPAAVTAAASASTPPVQPRTPPPTPPHQVSKRASSRAGLYVGALFGLLLIAGLVGGGGWFAYNKYNTASRPTPTPTAAPSALPSPSAAPILTEDQGSPSNIDSERTGFPKATPNSGQPLAVNPSAGANTSKASPQVATKATPARPGPTPGAKATPKPKQKDDRTVILQ